MPCSRESLATTGAEPLPVPPPMPAVINTRSLPMTTRPSDSLLSVAAISPSSGLPPAPRPRVTCSPIWHLLGASELTSACASVFRAQNSTPYVATFLSQSVSTIEARFHRLPSTHARRTIHRTPSTLVVVSLSRAASSSVVSRASFRAVVPTRRAVRPRPGRSRPMTDHDPSCTPPVISRAFRGRADA